jgi:hypothetical protein
MTRPSARGDHLQARPRRRVGQQQGLGLEIAVHDADAVGVQVRQAARASVRLQPDGQRFFVGERGNKVYPSGADAVVRWVCAVSTSSGVSDERWYEKSSTFFEKTWPLKASVCFTVCVRRPPRCSQHRQQPTCPCRAPPCQWRCRRRPHQQPCRMRRRTTSSCTHRSPRP